MYGVKGIIDGMIVLRDKGQDLTTALEIKTGKRKLTEHRSQVMIYSLLISERFKTPNESNILLYIMDEDLQQEGFKYIRQTKNELDYLIMCRNKIAKWQKRNQQTLKFPEMIDRPSECQKGCFNRTVCSMIALSIESDQKLSDK